MVPIFMALTIVVLLAIDYFIIQPRRKQAQVRESTGHPIPLMKTIQPIPPGLFLQPSFTWTRFEENGRIMLGIHPLIMGLIGPPYEVELLKDKESVKKGEPLVKINKNGRIITLKSPVNGEIHSYNQALLGETDWEHLNMSWLYEINPVQVSAELPAWKYSEDAGQWVNQKFQEMKSFVFDKLSTGQIGVTMADGGDIPVGILSELNQEDLDEFQTHFLR